MVAPYYQDSAVTIYHGDCRDILPQLSGIDLVLTSPPFNLGNARGSEWKALANGYEHYSDNLPHDEYVSVQRDVLRLCWDTLTGAGAIFYQHKPIAKGNEVRLPLELNPGLPLRQIVTWDRGGGFTRNAWHYTPRYEWLLLFTKPDFRITRLNVDDLWRINPERSDHPAPFPLSLARRAIGTTAAQTVLDPFMGFGTTLRAALDMNRTAIGIDISERYCEAAAKRLGQGVLELGGMV